MADIQSSLRRLQESIRGLSDASALVGAVNLSENGDDEQPLETSAPLAPSSPGSLARRRSISSGRQRTASPSSSAFDDTSGREYRDHRDGLGGELSPVGGSAKQDEQQGERSFLSSIPRDLRESAEVRETQKQVFELLRTRVVPRTAVGGARRGGVVVHDDTQQFVQGILCCSLTSARQTR